MSDCELTTTKWCRTHTHIACLWMSYNSFDYISCTFLSLGLELKLLLFARLKCVCAHLSCMCAHIKCVTRTFTVLFPLIRKQIQSHTRNLLWKLSGLKISGIKSSFWFFFCCLFILLWNGWKFVVYSYRPSHNNNVIKCNVLMVSTFYTTRPASCVCVYRCTVHLKIRFCIPLTL